MRISILLACTCFAFATSAIAKDPLNPAEDKVICKRQQEADTGSHFATTKKVCLRKSEWKQLEDAAEGTLRKVREIGGACPKCLVSGSGGGPG